MTTDKKESTLSGKTKFRGDLVITLLAGATFCGILYNKIDSMQAQLRKQWTIQHQILWSKEFAADNPGLKVPEPQAVVDLMNQKSEE